MDELLPTNNEPDFKQLFEMISARRSRASQTVNDETLLSAWEVGAFVAERLKTEKRGSKTVTQLAEFLRSQDSSLRGYSRANIYNMVTFYNSYSSSEFLSYANKLKFNSRQKQIVQFGTGQLQGECSESEHIPELLLLTTFTNHVEILNRCKTIEERLFYIPYTYKAGRKIHCGTHEIRDIEPECGEYREDCGVIPQCRI